MSPTEEQSERAEAVLRAVGDSGAREVREEEAGEVERQSQQVESAFRRARQRKDWTETQHEADG